MAQWVPKTAWRVCNLNKRYGQPYLLGGNAISEEADQYLASYATMASRSTKAKSKALRVIAAAHNVSQLNPTPGTCVIDVRQHSERKELPLSSSLVVPLHPHDILSGAANPLLPYDKVKTKLFIVSSSTQRGVNVLSSLRRWGYHQCTVVDYTFAFDLLSELKS